MENPKIKITTGILAMVAFAINFALIFVAGAGLSLHFAGSVGLRTESEDEEVNYNLAEVQATFNVSVPQNTPGSDTIYLHSGNSFFAMTQTSDRMYTVTVSLEDLGSAPTDNALEQRVGYSYSRNGLGYVTTEFLEPDRFENWSGRRKWTLNLQDKEHVKTDSVERWKWFPPANQSITVSATQTPSVEFQPRISNNRFRSGQVFQDWYSPAFENFYASTAEHLQDKGYEWIVIAPPWDWVETDPLPVVGNPLDINPNYPDEKLREHLQATKDTGMKIIMQPQVCCTALDSENKSAAWWNAYIAEYQRFLLHYAEFAEEFEVEALYFAMDYNMQHSLGTKEADRRWREVIANVREVYSGEVGQLAWSFKADPAEPDSVLPGPEQIPWGDALDFFYVSVGSPLSYNDEVTDEDLVAGAGRVLDGIKPLHDAFGKPVIAQESYMSVEKSWLGNSFYDINSVPGAWTPEQEIVESKYSYSGVDQERVVHALFTAIAERPWITGMTGFSYWPWDMPLAADLSVRDKKAEENWSQWNEYIAQ